MRTHLFRKKYAFYVLLSFLATYFLSCKKTEFVVAEIQTVDAKATALFFRLPANVNPSVKRVADEMRSRNDISEYITGFAKNNGFPIWTKPY